MNKQKQKQRKNVFRYLKFSNQLLFKKISKNGTNTQEVSG